MSRSRVLINIDGNAQNFKRALGDIKKETRSLESGLKTIATRGAIAFTGLAAGIGFAVTEAAKFEQINTQFQVLIGNAEGAQKALDELKDFSASTPFQFESIAKAGQQLLGFGFAADELRPRLEEIGNVAAAVGKPIDEIGLIFGQVSAAGKLTGERLLQFQERAIPIGPAIAETLGVAESSVKQLVSEGAVDFATFQKAFQSLSKEGGIAFGALDKQSQTVSGQFSTLKDNVSLLVADFGQEFFPVVRSVTGALTSFIKVLRENPELVKYGATVIGVTAAVSGLVTVLAGSILVFIKVKAAILAAAAVSPLLAAGLGGVSAAATAAGTALKFAFANPLGLALTAVAAGIATIIAFRKEIVAGFGAALDVVRGFAENASDNLNGFRKILQGIATFNFDLAKEGFQDLFDLEGEGQRAADTFKKGYAERIASFKEEEASRQDELTSLRVEKQQEQNEALLEAQREFKSQELEQKAEQNEEEVALEEARQNALAILKKKSAKKLTATEKKELKEREKQKKQSERDREQATGEFLGNLSSLQRANDEKLFKVGRAASLASAVVNIAEGITKALSKGPILGPALAASIAASGAVQISAIKSQTFQAQKGFSGSGSPFGESFVSTFTPREIVVPERFSEGIKKGEFSLSKPGQGGESGQSSMQVTIGFTDDAFEIIEEKLIERETIGTSLRG